MVVLMESAPAVQLPPKRQIPALVDRSDHETMRSLATHHERSIGGEYRAAVKAWIKQHDEQSEASA